MANLNPKINYEELIVEWQTTDKSVYAIAKEHGINESSLRKYIKRYKLVKKPIIADTITSLDRGLAGLAEIQQTDTFGLLPQDKAERLNMLIQNEVIEIVRSKNPEFARSLQVISAKVIKKTNQLLDMGIDNTRELKDITSIMKDINDTLQVIPKPAGINQQINIQQNQNKQTNTNVDTTMQVNVRLIKNDEICK